MSLQIESKSIAFFAECAIIIVTQKIQKRSYNKVDRIKNTFQIMRF